MDRVEAALEHFRAQRSMESLRRELSGKGSWDNVRHLNVAIEALREKQERESGCEWCNYFEQDRQMLISRGNGMYEEFMRSFCPNCGKRLKEEA